MRILIGPHAFDLKLKHGTRNAYIFEKSNVYKCVDSYDFLAIGIPHFTAVFSISMQQLLSATTIVLTFNSFKFHIKPLPFYTESRLKCLIEFMEVEILN